MKLEVIFTVLIKSCLKRGSVAKDWGAVQRDTVSCMFVGKSCAVWQVVPAVSKNFSTFETSETLHTTTQCHIPEIVNPEILSTPKFNNLMYAFFIRYAIDF
jgi:hypothetical protein